MLQRKDISGELKKSFESLAYYHQVTIDDSQGEFKVREVLNFFRELAEKKEGDDRATKLIDDSRNYLRRILAAETRLNLNEAFCDRVFEAQIILAKAFPVGNEDCILLEEISPDTPNLIAHSSGHLTDRESTQQHYNSSYGISAGSLKHPATTEALSVRELKSLRSQGITHSQIPTDGRDIYSYSYTQIALILMLIFLILLFAPVQMYILLAPIIGAGFWPLMERFIFLGLEHSGLRGFLNGAVAAMLVIVSTGFFYSLIISLFVAHSFVSPLVLIIPSGLVSNLYTLGISLLISVVKIVTNQPYTYIFKGITNYILAVPELIIDQTIGRLFTGLKNLLFSKSQQQLPDDPTRPRWLALEAPSQSIHAQLDISPKSALHSGRDSGLPLAVETKGDSKAEHKNDVLAGEVERFQQIVSAYTGLDWMDIESQKKYKSGMDKVRDRAMKSCVGLSSEEDLLTQKRAFYQVLNLFKDEIITKKDYKCVQALESYLDIKVAAIRKGRDILFPDFEVVILQKNRLVSALSV